MATTEILQYAGGGSANVLSQTAYAALTSILTNGMSSGIVPSNQLNKILRQSSFMAAGLAAFCVAQGVSVPDDGNLANLVTEITSAVISLVGATGLQKSNNLSDLSSLSTALTNLGFVTSALNNGYAKLPSGIIIQWGSYSSSGAGATTHTFPITFPNACLQVIGSDASGPQAGGFSQISTSQFNAYHSASFNFRMFSIGY